MQNLWNQLLLKVPLVLCPKHWLGVAYKPRSMGEQPSSKALIIGLVWSAMTAKFFCRSKWGIEQSKRSSKLIKKILQKIVEVKRKTKRERERKKDEERENEWAEIKFAASRSFFISNRSKSLISKGTKLGKQLDASIFYSQDRLKFQGNENRPCISLQHTKTVNCEKIGL